MSDDRYRDKHSGTSVNGHNNSEQRAREQAYQEYLSLRGECSNRFAVSRPERDLHR